VSAEQVAFLTEYDQWKSEKRVSRDDLSPEAFLIDRAKVQALEKLIKISDLMNEFYEADWDTTEEYEAQCTKLHDAISEVLED
jgi:hypothetical protein